MKKNCFTLFIPILWFLQSDVQIWDNPFFTMEIPSSWVKNITHEIDNINPSRVGDRLKEYVDVRHIPHPDNGIGGWTISVRLYEDREGKKLNYKDFIRSNYSDDYNIIEINGLKAAKRFFSMKSPHPGTGEIIESFHSEWILQGEKRVYRFAYSSVSLKRHKEKLESVKKSLSTFSEK